VALALGLAALALPPGGDLSAQIVASERGTVKQTISGTEIEIEYSRPSARGRADLFGGVVHWMEVWTPGANDATKLRVSKDITLNGMEVPAGTYTVWIQPRESEDWVYMLHPDTTLFHLPHPSLDEAFDTVRVEAATGSDFVETLSWDIQDVRPDQAVMELSWGHHRVALEMGVDPGFDFTTDPDEAERYTGTWILDETPGLPADSVIAGYRANMEADGASEGEIQDMLDYFDSMREPRDIRVEYEAESEHLYVWDAVTAWMWNEDGSTPNLLLMPRAEGVFVPALLMLGEVAFADAGQDYVEFEFDDDGQAVRFTRRSGRDDSVLARGTRGGGSP
jgi:hypothetical protein